jgi:NAD(P)-dependent dehydrogenase (short-subunit alcohol dehydrogenase family)
MPSVLLTGASTGIGRATALRLDSSGWRVFAGVRRDADAEALRDAASERLTPLLLDVTDSGQIEAAARQVEGELGGAGLDGLLNNAGIGIPSPLEMVPVEDLRRQLEVNLVGQVAVTRALLPQLRAARGRIVFISSIGGRIAFPTNGAYHAAKFGLEAVGDVFRQELRPWGISVSIVEPGAIATPIWESSEREADALVARDPAGAKLYAKHIDGYRTMSRKLARRGIPPERVAATIEDALTSPRPRARYPIGFEVRAQVWAKALIPTRTWDAIVARIMGL